MNALFYSNIFRTVFVMLETNNTAADYIILLVNLCKN